MWKATATCSVLLLLMAVSTSAASVKTADTPANPWEGFNLTKVLTDLNVTKILQDMKAKADADAALKVNVAAASSGSQVQFSLNKFFQDIKAKAAAAAASSTTRAGSPTNPLKDFNLTKVLADLNATKILRDMKAKADADAAIKANATAANNGGQVPFSLTKFFQDIKTQADANAAAAAAAAKPAASSNSTASDNSTLLSIVIGNKTITFKKPTKPSAYNATVPILTITSVFAMLQELASTQPLVQALGAMFSPISTASRSLLENDDVLDPANFQYEMGRSLLADDSPTNDTTPAATPATSTTNTVQKTNAKKIGSRVNLLMSDAWLVAYSGFNVGRAAIQLLAALIKATATGTLTIDATLLLTFADLSAGFSANVNYLLYSIQKLAADSIAPLGTVKTSPSPKPSPSPSPVP